MTIQKLALKYLKLFKLKERPDGSKFYVLKDKPTEFLEFVYTLHEYKLPNDLIYEVLYNFLIRISEYDSDDYDSLLDEEEFYYDNELLDWFHEFYYHVNNYVEEYGLSKEQNFDIMNLIRNARASHNYFIRGLLLDFLKKNSK